MVRPCASPENRQLGIMFAEAVTAAVPCEQPGMFTIARSGQYSLFEMFTQCFRRSTRDNSRNGLSPIEMNKNLEKNGFLRLRVRKTGLDNRPFSYFLYGARRWRNPDNYEDFLHLRAAWAQVNAQAPTKCSLTFVLHLLREAVATFHPRECQRQSRKSSSSSSSFPAVVVGGPTCFPPLVRQDSITSQATTASMSSPRSEGSSPLLGACSERHSPEDGGLQLHADMVPAPPPPDSEAALGPCSASLPDIQACASPAMPTEVGCSLIAAAGNAWDEDAGDDLGRFLEETSTQPITDLSAEGLMNWLSAW